MGSNSSNRESFENVCGHTVGVTILDALGNPRGAAVSPGDRIFLNEEEQRLTAQAPRRDEDNPLANGKLKLVSSAAGKPSRSTRPADAETAEIADGDGDDESPEGTRPPTEEVGTPSASRARKRASN